MITIYIFTLLILITIPCYLYFEKLGDLFSKINSIFTSTKTKIQKNIEKNKITREYEEEIKNLKIQLKEKEDYYTSQIEELKNKLEKEKTKSKPKIVVKEKFSSEDVWEKGKKYKCRDGQKVRSKAEREIDDFLYLNRIWHIYESEYQHPYSKELARPDFYLPDYNLYIEYFGLKSPEYLKKKENKIKMYKSDKSINFEYLTCDDDKVIYEKLKRICIKYSIPMKK